MMIKNNNNNNRKWMRKWVRKWINKWIKKMKNKKNVISFDLEVTARCNNNCRHCYINLPVNDKAVCSIEPNVKANNSVPIPTAPPSAAPIATRRTSTAVRVKGNEVESAEASRRLNSSSTPVPWSA